MKRSGFTLVGWLFVMVIISMLLFFWCGMVWHFVKLSELQSTSQPVQAEEVED